MRETNSSLRRGLLILAVFAVGFAAMSFGSAAAAGWVRGAWTI
jgi:hypothetical protein